MPEITDPTESPSRSARHPNRDNQVLARHFWRAGNAWYLPSRVPARPSRAAFSSPACSNGVWSLALAASDAERSPRQLLLRSRDATGASSSLASDARRRWARLGLVFFGAPRPRLPWVRRRRGRRLCGEGTGIRAAAGRAAYGDAQREQRVLGGCGRTAVGEAHGR